jgi:hypothetical protein
MSDMANRKMLRANVSVAEKVFVYSRDICDEVAEIHGGTRRKSDPVDNILGFAGTMLPAQYFIRRLAEDEDRGADKLWLAVLIDAIGCYLKTRSAPSRRGILDSWEARRWIFVERRGIGSFHRVCDNLELDPQYLRNGLRRAKNGWWRWAGEFSIDSIMGRS